MHSLIEKGIFRTRAPIRSCISLSTLPESQAAPPTPLATLWGIAIIAASWWMSLYSSVNPWYWLEGFTSQNKALHLAFKTEGENAKLLSQKVISTLTVLKLLELTPSMQWQIGFYCRFIPAWGWIFSGPVLIMEDDLRWMRTRGL